MFATVIVTLWKVIFYPDSVLILSYLAMNFHSSSFELLKRPRIDIGNHNELYNCIIFPFDEVYHYRRDHIYTRAWVKYESIIRKTKRVGGRGVDLNITIILDPWFFWNYIVYFDRGLVAPVSRSEFDERLGDSYEI